MSGDRFDQWNRTARTCFRASSFIDSARQAIEAARVNVEAEVADPTASAQMREALKELQAAGDAIFGAREKLAAALKEKTLTAKTRDPEFWKAGT